LAAIQAEGAQSSSAFDSVTGLSEFAVGVLNRIGIPKLYPSQRLLLDSLGIKDIDGKYYSQIIIAPHGAGKSMVLAFSAFTVIMTSLITVEQSASSAEQPPVSAIDQSASDADQSPSPLPTRHNSSLPCKPRALIVCPVHETAKEIGKFLNLLLGLHGQSCVTLVGGVPVKVDITALRKWPTAVVGTPGRLLDHMDHDRLTLSRIIYCAVDEIDTSS